MALKVKTEAKDALNNHYFSDYSAFLDSDDDFYLIDNDSGDLVVQLEHSGCRVFAVPAGVDTIESFLEKAFGKGTYLKRVYRDDDDYDITVEAS